MIIYFSIYESPEYLPQLTNHQESSMISTSAPAQSMSTDRSESPAKKNDHQVLHEKGTTPSKKVRKRVKTLNMEAIICHKKFLIVVIGPCMWGCNYLLWILPVKLLCNCFCMVDCSF
jgi:hypothetical protein